MPAVTQLWLSWPRLEPLNYTGRIISWAHNWLSISEWHCQFKGKIRYFFKSAGMVGYGRNQSHQSWQLEAFGQDPYLVYDSKRHVKNKEPQTSLLVQELTMSNQNALCHIPPPPTPTVSHWLPQGRRKKKSLAHKTSLRAGTLGQAPLPASRFLFKDIHLPSTILQSNWMARNHLPNSFLFFLINMSRSLLLFPSWLPFPCRIISADLSPEQQQQHESLATGLYCFRVNYMYFALINENTRCN